MANSQAIMDTQPATESQAASQCTLLESQPVEKPVYGRLCGKNVQIKSLGTKSPIFYIPSNASTNGSYDLYDGVFSVGRDSNCELSLDTDHMPENKLSRVSKVHFIIQKQEDDYDAPVYITDKSRNGTYVNGKIIGTNRQRLLKDGDIISICYAELKAFAYQELRRNTAIKQLVQDLPGTYFIGKTLGSGACGVVYLLHHTETCEQYALKQVVKNRMTEQQSRPRPLNDPARVMNEVNIMKNLDHPCVIRMHDIIDKPHSLYMVLEYMKGGDLLSRILANRRLPEKTSKLFFLQMCHAVKYLHSQGITHRDLKPDNILLADEEEYTLLKVSDFGLSRFVGKNSVMRTLCGTPMYVAPEVLLTRGTGSYTPKVDIWGLGVVLYTMLSGTMPFSDDFGTPAVEQIKRGKFSFRHPVWRTVSSKAKKLIYEILNINPKERPSIDTVLASSWMRDPDVIAEAERLMECKLTTMQRPQMQPPRQPNTLSDVENNNTGRSSAGRVFQPPRKKQRM
ncbi:ovarian-specific serine/threonine-protein kinase Lok-like isoform X1 [Anopheles albimanus]|uniref:ovarian-specific serine/threonine-protein kinase Lok-like isoform X1 n=1 Tax=Anopheles albimanus TaxID=7167 RepID=UPI00163FC21B|nr:ovarian-specific serine/threonine-protein kinase Lok-like isoform X1 [Anopheles albimanus]